MRKSIEKYSMIARRSLLGGAIVTLALLAGASSAFADSATMSVTTTDGKPDPASGVSRVFTVTGNSATPKNLYVKYRPTGGAPCAPTADQDTGKVFKWYSSAGASQLSGDFTLKQAETWTPAGSFAFCYWLATSATQIATPFTQTITFRAPSGTITASINPVSPQPGQAAAVTVTGSTETPAQIFAKVRPAGGAPCAATYSDDPGRHVLNFVDVDGTFSKQTTLTLEDAGNYVLCLWLARSGTDTSPIAGPQPQPFSVVAPPPPVLPPGPTLIGSKVSAKRQGVRAVRYSGRVTTTPGCRRNRSVVLRRVGFGARSFGRAVTRADGTYTIRRSRRLRGRVYTVVSQSKRGVITCTTARSSSFRG